MMMFSGFPSSISLLKHRDAPLTADWMQVPLEEDKNDTPLPDLMPALRAAALADRDVLEKGIRAFVSYVRGYKEHHCKYIFRMQDLDLAKLASACALLQLPRMPEIRKLGGKAEGFTPADVNPNMVKVCLCCPAWCCLATCAAEGCQPCCLSAPGLDSKKCMTWQLPLQDGSLWSK